MLINFEVAQERQAQIRRDLQASIGRYPDGTGRRASRSSSFVGRLGGALAAVIHAIGTTLGRHHQGV